jgi:tetratricopeptide (TPR) repeat protein
MIAMYTKNAGKAKEALALWLHQDPNNSGASKLAALLALKDEDQAKAVGHFEVLLKTPADDFETAVLEVAAVMQKENKLSAVTDTLAALSTKHKDQAIVPYLQSFFAAQMHNKALAESYLQNALTIKTDWDKALIWKSQMAAVSGDLSKAESVLRYGIGKHPENQKMKRLLAQVLIKSDNYEEASTVFQDIIADNPSDYESQLSLGLVYLQDDQNDQAEDIFKSLLDQPEWRLQASFYLGKLEEKRGNPKAALVWYDKVIDGPFAFDASASAVMLMAKEKQYNEAGLKATAMLAKFPKEKVRILLIQSEIFNKQKNYRQAFNLLTSALVDEPDEDNLLYTRALMAERLGKFELMELDLKKILAKNPKNTEALNALGYSLASRSNRYAEAEAYLLQALKLRPDEPVIVDSYGWLQFKMGRAAKALEYLRTAFNKQKENEIAAHLVEVLWALGQKDEAKDIFKEAIKASPDDEYLLEVEQRILKNAE